MGEPFKIFLDDWGRFGNNIYSVTYLIATYAPKYNGNIIIYAKKYIVEFRNIFNIQFEHYTDDVQYDIKFETLFIYKQKRDIYKLNDETLNIIKSYIKYDNLYKIVENINIPKTIIHWRLGDYLTTKNIKCGYYAINKQYITYVLNKYNINTDDCAICSDSPDIILSNLWEGCPIRILNYDSFITWVLMLFCKTLVCSASTYSTSAGTFGHCEKLIIPYPYILNYKTKNTDHEFIYTDPKIEIIKLL